MRHETLIFRMEKTRKGAIGSNMSR